MVDQLNNYDMVWPITQGTIQRAAALVVRQAHHDFGSMAPRILGHPRRDRGR